MFVPPETKAVIGPGQRSCSFQKPTFMTFHGQIILVLSILLTLVFETLVVYGKNDGC